MVTSDEEPQREPQWGNEYKRDGTGERRGTGERDGDFDLLTPELVIKAAEAAFDLSLNGTLIPYNSYINRVYELQDEEGRAYMAKFYRPGRWSEEAILEEHDFIHDCVDMDIPTVAPLVGPEGETLASVEAVDAEDPASTSGAVESDAAAAGKPAGAEPQAAGKPAGAESQAAGKPAGAESQDHRALEYHFALFPKRGGRNFDAESEEDWLRLGALVGRMHAAARGKGAEHRQHCLPSPVIRQCLKELEDGEAVHPDHRQEFFGLAEEIRLLIEPLFEGLPLQRLHGDCHRGNILERPEEGLLIIDFDDMMVGPAVQDLWLLLPGRAEECPREFNLIAEGYERFLPFDYRQKSLIEPLRAMRMLYYLAWEARQRNDRRFRAENPHWGSAAFWSREIEDLRDQLEYCR